MRYSNFMRYRVTHYLVYFVRIDNLVSTTFIMWPETFLDSSPSGVLSNLPCHFNQFFFLSFPRFYRISFPEENKTKCLTAKQCPPGSPHLLFPRPKPCYKLRIYTVIENYRGGSRKFRRGGRDTCQRFRPSIILRIGHITVMNGSEADGDLEYRPPVHGPPLWT